MKRIAILILLAFIAAHPIFAQVTVHMYTSGNNIQRMIRSGDTIICATAGGVACWDTRTMSYRIYTIADGLPSNNTACIAQSPDGTLWCGTDKGIACFDGTSWAACSSLPEIYRSKVTQVRDIAVAPDSTVWVSCVGIDGVFREKNGEWTLLTTTDGLPGNTVIRIVAGNDGRIAFGTLGYGLGIFDGKTWKTYTVTDGIPDNVIYEIAMPDAQTIWVGTPWGAARFDGANWKKVIVDDGLISKNVIGIQETSDGIVHFTTDKGVSVYDGASFTSYTIAQGLGSSMVNTVVLGNDGSVWYGTENGLTREREGSLTTYRTQNTPAGKSVVDSALAPDGSLWFATGNGVSRYSGGKWTNYVVDDGLPEGSFSSIAVAGDGTVWAASTKGGVCRFDGTKWRMYTTDDGVVSNWMNAVAVGPDGVVWCGSQVAWPNGLCYFKDEKWTQVSTDEGMASTIVNCIDVGADNMVWVGTDQGACRFDGQKWTTFTMRNGLPSNYVQRILVFNNDTVAIGTNKRCVIYDGKYMDDFGSDWINGIVPASMAGDTRANLIFGVYDGMYELSNGKWNLYTTSSRKNFYENSGLTWLNILYVLPADDIRTVIRDREGTLWCGAFDGSIFSITSDQFPNVVEQELPRKLTLLGNHPNPFNPSTAISFTLPSSGVINLSIYNIAGQKVRELVNGPISAGSHSMVWDGLDASGKAVSSGVYLSRLKMGRQTVAGRMLLAK